MPNWLRAAVVLSCCCYELCPVLMLYATGRQKKGKRWYKTCRPRGFSSSSSSSSSMRVLEWLTSVPGKEKETSTWTTPDALLQPLYLAWPVAPCALFVYKWSFPPPPPPLDALAKYRKKKKPRITIFFCVCIKRIFIFFSSLSLRAPFHNFRYKREITVWTE